MIDPRIIGTWRLKSTIGRDDAGAVLAPPYGPAAMGLVVFDAIGRMMAVLCDGRKALAPNEPRQFMSYAGITHSTGRRCRPGSMPRRTHRGSAATRRDRCTSREA